MENPRIGKAKVFIAVEIIEHIPNSVPIKTIIKKTTGIVSVVSFDSGETLSEKTTPFDCFMQAHEGEAEVMIDGESNLLNTLQFIIIPTHSPNVIKANVRFKMISSIIKSSYEKLSLD